MSSARLSAFLLVLSGCAAGVTGDSTDVGNDLDDAEKGTAHGKSPKFSVSSTEVATSTGTVSGSTDTGTDTGTAAGTDVYGAYSLYVASGSNASKQAALWRTSDPDAAALMDDMADEPLALWIGDWTSDPAATVDAALDAAGGKLRTLVVYNIPNRDCGAWSAGGATDATAYATFVGKIATGLGGRTAIIVLEPDAVPLTHCLTSTQKTERFAMMSAAVDTLTAAGGKVYIDAGDSNWIGSTEIGAALKSAGVAKAAGFSLNVSHTEYEANEMAFAEEIRAIVGASAHYIIDTSRSGVGPAPDNEWCNPPDRALGSDPTLTTGVDGLDALLWIKPPGESDGSCNGGPSAGRWWPEYALGLAEVASAL